MTTASPPQNTINPLSKAVITLIAVDVAFALVTGGLGIHGLIVDVGANIGADLGIEPLFDGHAGHGHGIAEATNACTGTEHLALNDTYNTHAQDNFGHHDHGHGYSGQGSTPIDTHVETHTDHSDHGHHATDSYASNSGNQAPPPPSVDGETHAEHSHSGNHSDHNHGGMEYDVEQNVVKKDGAVQFGQKYLKPHFSPTPEF